MTASTPRRERPIARSGLTRSLDYIAVITLLTSFTIGDFQVEYSAGFPVIKWYVLIGFLVYSLFRNASNIRMPRSLTFWLLLTFVCVATASTFVHLHTSQEAEQRTASWAILLAISFGVPTPPCPFQRLEIWTRSLLIVGVALILVSFLGLYSPANYLSTRFRGLVSHPNHLAILVCFPLLTALALVTVKRQAIRAKVPLIGVISAGTALILLSDSRSGIIACIVGALGLLLLGLNLNRFLRLVTGLGLAAGLLALLLNAVWSGDATRTAQRSFALTDRGDIWQRQIDAFLLSPWIGHGLELGTAEAYGSLMGRAGGEGSYTDLLSAAGVFGAGPFILACLLGLRNMRNGYRRTPQQFRVYYVAGVGCLTSVLTVAIGEGWLAAVGGVPPIVAWICLGAFDTISRQRQAPRMSLRMRRIDPLS